MIITYLYEWKITFAYESQGQMQILIDIDISIEKRI